MMTALATRCLPFTALTLHEWHDIVRLRVDVFVVEQDCAYSEIDGRDLGAQHMLAYAGGQLHGYARILFHDSEDKVYHVGRVVLRASHRRHGWGTNLMEACLRWIEKQEPKAIVRVQAQAHLQAWYEELGFQLISDKPYDWDGIPHVDMENQL